eukprot:TRINITY_DN1997_c0_g1_i7.p1 TRINITY_DN1997_c0_g1~~TRINITY_DN1997_c0_g1_i7.p1  ORF type:complete len:321 (-),score=58.73 TRINITY_DN1997_c0_g1_i7:55-1017(-)
MCIRDRYQRRVHGGKVLVAKKVKQILLDEKQQKVIGVQMNDKDNTIIKSKNVICAGNFICAIERLLPHSFQEDPEYKYMREKTEISFSTLFIFMGFDGTNEELGFTSANESFCSMDLKDTANTIDDLLNANTISFISFHSTKIKGWAEKYPYKSAGVIMVGHDYEIFEKWAGTLPEKRGQDYEALKSRIAQAYISKHLLKAYPHLKNRIAYTEVGTSLTTENLLEAYKGTSCGIKMNIQRNDRRIDKYLNRQSVGGLWFCGQDLMGAGLLSVLFSGIFVASKILGYWGLTDTLTGRIFFKDFQNLMKHLENENLEKKKQD